MRVGSIAKTGLHLIAGCSLVLLVGTGVGTAFAHGGGSGHSGGTEHHDHPTMAGNPPLHGPGSSHNPIVTPVTVVRDHRTPPPRPNRYCNHHNIKGCEVRDHRTPPAPQCLGDLC